MNRIDATQYVTLPDLSRLANLPGINCNQGLAAPMLRRNVLGDWGHGSPRRRLAVPNLPQQWHSCGAKRIRMTIDARLLAVLIVLATAAPPAGAQTLTLDLNGETRAEALAQIVPDGSAEITWRNPALADEPVQGHFEGSEQQVLKEILAPADFVAVYAEDNAELKITKLIVLDKEEASSGPAQTTPVTEPPPNQLQVQEQQKKQEQQQQELARRRQMLLQQRMQAKPNGMPAGVNGRMPPAAQIMRRRLPLMPEKQQ